MSRAITFGLLAVLMAAALGAASHPADGGAGPQAWDEEAFFLEPPPGLKPDAGHGGGHGDGHGDAAHAAGPHHGDGPVVPQGRGLAGVTIILIVTLFVLALVIGPIVRAVMPEEVPETHSHDEPPGSSGHHGASGQLNPEPGHGHGGHH